MKKEYSIKPFKQNLDLKKIDDEKRKKIEEITGKMSDSQWFEYKRMTMNKNKT